MNYELKNCLKLCSTWRNNVRWCFLHLSNFGINMVPGSIILHVCLFLFQYLITCFSGRCNNVFDCAQLQPNSRATITQNFLRPSEIKTTIHCWHDWLLSSTGYRGWASCSGNIWACNWKWISDNVVRFFQSYDTTSCARKGILFLSSIVNSVSPTAKMLPNICVTHAMTYWTNAISFGNSSSKS